MFNEYYDPFLAHKDYYITIIINFFPEPASIIVLSTRDVLIMVYFITITCSV